jgi:hypothetical protein
MLSILAKWLRWFGIVLGVFLFSVYALGFIVISCLKISYQKSMDSELQILSHEVSPDGRLEARLERVVGGPPMGGAVLWQELHIVRPCTPLHYRDNDQSLAFSVNSESEVPAATFRWISPNRLLVNLTTPDSPMKVLVSGVRIVYILPPSFDRLPRPQDCGSSDGIWPYYPAERLGLTK